MNGSINQAAQKNYYELLRISPQHPQQLIPQAFRSSIKLVHPDKNTDGSRDFKQATIEMYEAYRVLSDPTFRRQYDQKLQQSLLKEQLASNRYFQDTALFEKQGKWYVQCQQCMGNTQLKSAELQAVRKSNKECFVRCWHCSLPLSLSSQAQ